MTDMIQIKNEINKSATMRDLRKVAEKVYEHSLQPELQVEAFMEGAKTLLNLLHLPHVSNTEEELICPECNCNKAYWNPVEEYNECPCGYNWVD